MKFADDIVNDHREKVLQIVPKDGQLDQAEKKKTLSKKYLVNRLNYINFQGGAITINFKHAKYDDIISIQAKPYPCLNDSLHCFWAEPDGLTQKLKTYQYLHFVIPNNRKLILVEAGLEKIDDDGISFSLPESCCEITSRSVKRHRCEGIEVLLAQNGAIFSGSLVDFNAVTFKVEITTIPPQTFQWVNPESSVTLMIKAGQETLYTGECRIIRQNSGQHVRSYVVKPLRDNIRRFKPREYRSTRHKLVPSPNIIFSDPFTGKTINLKVIDLSGSGFSVEEDEHNSILVPGVILPVVRIDFVNIFQITCKAQVIYRNVCNGDGRSSGMVKCGLAILDMDLQDHVRLLGFLQQAEDGNTYVCTRVDLDELWDFFFETGFLYPKKYSFIQNYKEEFKSTYEKLYTRSQNVARYFIYQQNGIIYAHMAMIRFYRNTWLIQHHASRKSNSYKPGLLVLNQISRYVNEVHKLYSAHLHFVCCYFRPDNKFPTRVFGGVAKYIDDPKGCSVDKFAYFHLSRPSLSPVKWDLSGPWTISKAKYDELCELESFYKYESGGLMINAMDLEPGMIDTGELSAEYRKLGFNRERHLFSLKKDGALKAIIMVNTSNIGLNMSDLTNCLKVIVLDENELPKDILHIVLTLLSVKFEQDEIPVLLYPLSYAEKQSIQFERIYSLWVLNLQYLDQYFRFCEKMMTHAWHE
jgi:hypothetical protein